MSNSSRSLAERELGLNHGLDSVVHILDEVLLGATKSSPVRDIEDAIARVRVLSVATTDLHIELISDALEARPVLG